MKIEIIQTAIDEIIFKLKNKEELSDLEVDRVMDVLRAYSQVLWITSHQLGYD